MRPMDPRWRNGLIAAAASVLAVGMGTELAGGNLAPAIAVALLCGCLLITWSGIARPDTLLLGFLVLGYMLGNRGFAQIAPIPGLPILLFGEIGLAACGILLLVRSAMRRELPFKYDALNLFALLIILVSAGRMVVDFPLHGFVAVRDFATIYYIGFFFIAQDLVRQDKDRRWLRGTLTTAAALLPAVIVAFHAFTDFFIGTLTLGGIPIIFIKDDLAATFALAGVFILLEPARAQTRLLLWRWVAAGASLLAGLALLSRAAVLGLVVASLWLLLARRFRVFKLALVAGPAAVVLALGAAFVTDTPLNQTRLYGFVEHTISITDFDGRRAYQNIESADSGDNNRFRLVWWRTILERVMGDNPVFGMGFGFDLGRDFASIYQGVGDDFNVRSPHSIVFTILGRLGLLGCLLFAGLIWAMGRRTLSGIRSLQTDAADAAPGLSLWCAAWVVMVSAMFGVVLEGPMGAVVFWSLLGLAAGTPLAKKAIAQEIEPSGRSQTVPPWQETPEPANR